MALQRIREPKQLLALLKSSGAAALEPSSVVAAVFAAVVAAVATAVVAAVVAVVIAVVAVVAADVVGAELLVVGAENVESVEHPRIVQMAHLLGGAFPLQNVQSCISNRGRSVPNAKIDRAWFCGRCLWHEVHPLCGHSSS